MGNLLENKNIRATPFRTSVLNAFDNVENAISMHQIENTIGEHDRITLYRTIKLFKEKGVIHEISLPGEETKYALCSNRCAGHDHHHEHIHFKCSACNEVFCQEVDQFPKFEIPGFDLKKLEINAFGVCPKCQ